MTSRSDYHLRGAVRTCEVKRTAYSHPASAGAVANRRTDTTFLEFRPDGSVACNRHSNPDGSEWITSYEYDQSGQLSLLRTEDSARVSNVRFHEYAAGRLTRVFTRPDGTNEQTLESYEYDTEGQKTKTRPADARVHGYGVEGSDTAYPSKGAATVVTRYNHRDQPSELLFRDEPGRVLSRVDFRYDNDGKLTEETQTYISADPIQALFGPVHQLHTYDEQGRKLSTHMRIGQLSDETTTRTYNDQGDEIEVVNESIERSYHLDEEGRIPPTPAEERVTRSENLFSYEYDAGGNWTLKQIRSRSGEVWNEERRAITYFD